MGTEQEHNQNEESSEEDISIEEENLDGPTELDELGRAERKSARQKSALDTCLTEKKEYLDGWQRARAELQNARKHFEDEKREFAQFAERGLIEDLFTVLDSFSMAFSNREAWEKVDENRRKGVEYIHQQLLSTLETRGLQTFDPSGEHFNPVEHESVGTVLVADEEKEGIVMEVLQKGYRLNGKTIRPAKVRVSHYSENH